MLPQNTFNDPGSATAGTLFGGPYTGPDVCQETNEAFLVLDKDVTLHDAIAMDTGGQAPSQSHAYAISVGDVSNVVAYLYSSQIPPLSQYRSVPALHFKKGEVLYIRGIQLSEASTAAAEPTILVLSWAGKA